jgi:PKD repeat protein
MGKANYYSPEGSAFSAHVMKGTGKQLPERCWRRSLAVLSFLCFLGPVIISAPGFAASSGPAMDVAVSGDRGTAATTVSTSTFSTRATNELLLAFVSADSVKSPNITVTKLSGAGLTWQLVLRTNVQQGTAEIWRAFASSTLTNISVTATLSQSVCSSITVVSFTGVDTSGAYGSGAIGATASANGRTGVPAATLITKRSNSWVFGVGTDWDNPLARTPGPNQRLVHQYMPSSGDTYWVQQQTNPTPLGGTSVTINDTSPGTDRWNLAICEVMASVSTAALMANAGPSLSGYVGQSLTFSGSASGGIPPYSYSWNFGDGAIAATAVAYHMFSLAGTYNALLTATDLSGKTAQSSVTATIILPSPLTANAGASVSGYVGQTLTFKGSASGGVQPYAYAWSFGDGDSAIGATATNVYANSGTYIVKLTVTDYLGVSIQSSTNATILPTPLAANAGAPVSGYTGKSLNFAASVSGGTTPYKYSWDFGDGGTASTAIASHVYAGAGTYQVTLTITDASGSVAKANTTATITAVLPLTANAGTAVSALVGQSVTFAGSAAGGISPYSYSWNFGDGGVSPTATASHAYLSAGTYTVTLTITDSLKSAANSSILATITAGSQNPARPQPTILNTASSQYQNLVAAFPLWITDPTAPAVDLVNGISGAPTQIFVKSDLTMGNVFWSAGQSHFTIPYDTRLDFAYPNDTAHPFSVSVWVNVTIPSFSLSPVNDPANMYIAAFDANTTQYAWPGYAIGAAATMSRTGPITTELDLDGHQAQQSMFGNKVINDGQWHLLVFTYTPNQSTTFPKSTGQIYFDGVLDSTSNAMAQIESPAIVPPNALPNPVAMYIGVDDDGQSSPWQGMFCDLRFYSTALSASAIAAIYNPATRWELYTK